MDYKIEERREKEKIIKTQIHMKSMTSTKKTMTRTIGVWGINRGYGADEEIIDVLW